jgi:hypothetical protein
VLLLLLLWPPAVSWHPQHLNYVAERITAFSRLRVLITNQQAADPHSPSVLI